MSLLPVRAFDENYRGSHDLVIKEHLAELGILATPQLVTNIRKLCININSLRGLSREEARRRSASIGQLRADADKYREIIARQKDRCYWCGVQLSNTYIRQSLDHLIPKHMGDDPPDGSNWAITCTACNRGKGDIFVWAASAAAFDYVDRIDFCDPAEIGLKQRWCTLARGRRCMFCSADAGTLDLWVFRRVKTGLAIPANCAVACMPCGVPMRVEFLRPRWPEEEKARPYS